MTEGEGPAPVVILKPTSRVTSGAEVTGKLIAAAEALQDIMRTTYGPNGLDKMLYSTDGNASVTNDGAKIISELLIRNPAAKTIVALASAQEEACGDGVTTCVLFACELLRQAGPLLRQGIHPTAIGAGYGEAEEVLGAVLEQRAKPLEDDLRPVVATALTGRISSRAHHHLIDCILEALKHLDGCEASIDHPAEHVLMVRRHGAEVASSETFPGVVLEKRRRLDRMPEHLDAPRIACLTTSLQLPETERDAAFEIEDPDTLDRFMDAEDAHLDRTARRLVESGATVILITGTAHDRVAHALAEAGSLLLDGIDRPELEDLALATGAEMTHHLDDLHLEGLGHATSAAIELREDPEERPERLVLKGTPGPIVTIAVGGSDATIIDETIRGLHDALRSSGQVYLNPRTLTGGASWAAAAAHEVRTAAELQKGRARLAMLAFAHALERLPGILAENAGRDALDAVLELRAAHRTAGSDLGIREDGSVGAVEAALLPFATVEHATQSGITLAKGLLRVDQVISARGD